MLASGALLQLEESWMKSGSLSSGTTLRRQLRGQGFAADFDIHSDYRCK